MCPLVIGRCIYLVVICRFSGKIILCGNHYMSTAQNRRIIVYHRFNSIGEICCRGTWVHLNQRNLLLPQDAPKQSRTDAYGNFPLVFEPIRKLVHASREAIEFYKKVCNLNKKQMTKPNDLYYMANLKTIPKQIL